MALSLSRRPAKPPLDDSSTVHGVPAAGKQPGSRLGQLRLVTIALSVTTIALALMSMLTHSKAHGEAASSAAFERDARFVTTHMFPHSVRRSAGGGPASGREAVAGAPVPWGASSKRRRGPPPAAEAGGLQVARAEQGGDQDLGELSRDIDTAVGTQLRGWQWEGSLWRRQADWVGDPKVVAWMERRTVQSRLDVRKYVACAPEQRPETPDLSGLPLERASLKVPDFLVHQENYDKLGKGAAAPRDEAIVDASVLPLDGAAAEAKLLGGRRWGACAVVGNSGVLRLTDLGRAIDSHDKVFRINQAPVEGYSRRVGAKVTHRLLNRLWTRTYAKGARKSGTLLPLEENVTLVATRASGREFATMATFLAGARPDVSVLYLSSRATSMVTPLLTQYRERLCEAGFGPYMGLNVPSSGVVAVYMLLRLCTRVTVYGFGVRNLARGGQDGGDSDFGYHYYRGVGARTVGDDVHSFDTEERLLEQMGAEGVVQFCTYDPADSDGRWGCGCQHPDKNACRPPERPDWWRDKDNCEPDNGDCGDLQQRRTSSDEA